MPQDPHERARLVEAYRNANTSLAIEGLHMTAEDLALQQRVVAGEWSHDDFRAHVIAGARERNIPSPEKAKPPLGGSHPRSED